jgi:superoxide dismutase, Fe-Mn family
MEYQLEPLYCRPWTLNGISAKLIESHYENNYGSALLRLNHVTAQLQQLDLATNPPQAVAQLKREQMALLNSTLLHELYFASLGGDGRAVPERVATLLTRDFGSVERWRAEFVALATALAGGSGWALLVYSPRDASFINHIGTEHSAHVAGGIPVLALDMYEHAYHLEFGANAKAYIAAFMRNIDWAAVQSRVEDALNAPAPRKLVQPEFGDTPAISPEALRALVAAGTPLQIIDTRPRHYSSKSHEIMAGAVWRDPEHVDQWIGELSRDTPVVTFCVYGFHVGCQTAAALREAGFDARYMAGGHAAWKAMKGPVTLLE